MRKEVTEWREKEEEARRQSLLGHLGQDSSRATLGEDTTGTATDDVKTEGKLILNENLGSLDGMTSKLHARESRSKYNTIANIAKIRRQFHTKTKSESQPKASRVEMRRQREEKLKQSIEDDKVIHYTPKQIKTRIYEHEKMSMYKKIKRDRKEAKNLLQSRSKNNAYEKLQRIKRAQ